MTQNKSTDYEQLVNQNNLKTKPQLKQMKRKQEQLYRNGGTS